MKTPGPGVISTPGRNPKSEFEKSRRVLTAGLITLLCIVSVAGLALADLAQIARAPNEAQSALSGSDSRWDYSRFYEPAVLPLAEEDWVENVAEHDIARIYATIRKELQRLYMASGRPEPANYLGWLRFNRLPYVSPDEGISYRNNYANALAASAYAKNIGRRTFPAGSVLAKDSFVVTRTGEVLPGPMSLMEKMPEGFSPETADWRYTQIRTDGSVLGTTRGANADKTLFCVACHHSAGAKRDYVFAVPEAAR